MSLQFQVSSPLPKLCPPPTETYSSRQTGLFMVESSGRNTLTARQACAVESAVQQSGMQVILVVMATYLDLRDNTTCYLYMKSDKLKIFSLDIEKFAENSPIGNEFDKHNICAWTRQLNKQRQCFLKV